MKLPNRLFAVDPSLRATGWVLFSVQDERPIISGILGAPSDASIPLALRLDVMQRAVADVFEQVNLDSQDVLVCEGPAPLVLNPQSAIKVEHVRGVFETLARQRGVIVPGRINPRTVQHELLGMRGAQADRATVKSGARQVALRLFGETALMPPVGNYKNVPQDICDAALIGALVCARIKLAACSGQSLQSLLQEGLKSRRSSSQNGRAAWTESDLAAIRKRSEA